MVTGEEIDPFPEFSVYTLNKQLVGLILNVVQLLQFSSVISSALNYETY